MKAVVKVINELTPYEVECEVVRDGNKLVLEFAYNRGAQDVVPHPVIDHLWKKGVTVQLVKDGQEPECGDCNTCLTPIC